MSYIGKTFVNGQAPAIDADYLNGVEKCLVDLTDRDIIDVTATGVTWSRGKIARFGHNCMFDLEFTAPISTGGETDIYQFPMGYRPYMDFGLSIINPNDGTYVGVCEYSTASNTLSFRSIVQDAVSCRFYCSYVTADSPVSE